MAAGGRSGGQGLIWDCLRSAVEEGPCHLGEVWAGDAQQIGVSRRGNVHFPQRLLDVDEALDAPDGTYKHGCIPVWLVAADVRMG